MNVPLVIEFEPFEEGHLPLLRRWLAEPHVKEWWQEPRDEGELREKYTVTLQARGIRSQIIRLDGRPIGYIQSYDATGIGGGWWEGVPHGTYGMDQLIGDPEFVGRGLGSAIIRMYAERLLEEEDALAVIADPDPANLRAIRAYEKAGFEREGIVETPNGRAMLMRFVPAGARAASQPGTPFGGGAGLE